MSTHTMKITPEAFVTLLGMGADRKLVKEGLQTAVRMYYAEYTDADELDVEFMKALEVLGYVAGIDCDELVDDQEAYLRNQGMVNGRVVHTHTARCDHTP